MTTYTAIADADIDPESPGNATLFTRIRDNPIAITEGAAGAPSIANAALAETYGLIKVGGGALSGTTNFTGIFTSDYEAYVIYGNQVRLSNSTASLQARWGVGGSYKSTSYYERIGVGVVNQMVVAIAPTGNSDGGFCIKNYNMAVSKYCVSEIAGAIGAGSTWNETDDRYGQRSTTEAVTDIQFFPSAGTVSGNVSIYGVTL